MLTVLDSLNGETISLTISDTGNRKKEKTTASVKRPYIDDDLGKFENGILAVTAMASCIAFLFDF